MVEWRHDNISYLFAFNRATLQTLSGFFPSFTSLLQQDSRLEARERVLSGAGRSSFRFPRRGPK